MERKRHLGVAVGAVVLAAACTANSDPSPDLRESAVCTDASGVNLATNGAISAGPFDENLHDWTDPGGAKLWVRTSRDQESTTAEIEARPLGISPVPTGGAVTQRRGSDQIAEVADPGGLFYPGSLQLPEPGQWRLSVTIGGDDGCFLFVAR